MKRRFVIPVALALLAMGLGGCASNNPPKTLEQKLADQGYTLGGEAREIKSYSVDGWNYIDNTHVIVDTGPGRKYLLTLYSYCQGLDGAENLGLTTSVADNIDRFENVIVRDVAGTHHRCAIKAVHKLVKIDKRTW